MNTFLTFRDPSAGASKHRVIGKFQTGTDFYYAVMLLRVGTASDGVTVPYIVMLVLQRGTVGDILLF